MNSPQWPRGIPSFTFKEWMANEAERIGISASALKGRIDRGKNPRPLRIFKSCNVTSVVLWHPRTGVKETTEGLMPLGDWIKKEAARSGAPANTIRSRFRRGKYPALKITRFNQSKVFVSEFKNENKTQQTAGGNGTRSKALGNWSQSPSES